MREFFGLIIAAVLFTISYRLYKQGDLSSEYGEPTGKGFIMLLLGLVAAVITAVCLFSFAFSLPSIHGF